MKHILCVLCIVLTASFISTFAYAQTEGRVTYDFDPSTDELPVMYSYVSEYAFIDAEVAAAILLDDSQYQLTCNYDEGEVLTAKICSTENATIYSGTSGIFRYSTENIKYTREIASSFYEYPNDALAFMSQNDAIALCESTLNELGITAQAYEVRSLDVDTLIQFSNDSRADLLEWQELGKEVFIKDDWSTDDECYYIDLYQTIDGTPITVKGYYDTKTDLFFNGTKISMMVTRNGVERIDADYLIQPAQSGEVVDSGTMRTALDGYIADKNDELNSVDIHLVDMYVRYVQTFIPGENIYDSFKLIPAWALCMQYNQRSSDGEVHTGVTEVYCDIVTGKELRN